MTQINTDEKLNKLSEKIIGCVFAVHNKLGSGFLEKVYENALIVELGKLGLKVESQKPIQVFYDEVLVGDFVADLIVENKIILELKAVLALHDVHQAQCINYLKATGLPLCLLINFGKTKAEIKRFKND